MFFLLRQISMARRTIIRRSLPSSRDAVMAGDRRAGIAGKTCCCGFRRIETGRSLVVVGTGPEVIQLRDTGNVVSHLGLRLKATSSQRAGKDNLSLAINVLRLIRDTHNIGRIIGITGMTADTFRSQLVTSHGHGLAMTNVAVDRGADRGITMRLRRSYSR